VADTTEQCLLCFFAGCNNIDWTAFANARQRASECSHYRARGGLADDNGRWAAVNCAPIVRAVAPIRHTLSGILTMMRKFLLAKLMCIGTSISLTERRVALEKTWLCESFINQAHSGQPAPANYKSDTLLHCFLASSLTTRPRVQSGTTSARSCTGARARGSTGESRRRHSRMPRA